ncbi:MAG: thiamine ABC transporter substrate-binding protein [Spirochaetes bacterium]|nr:thiamine ABC transporter substrate-binding protein [Spirochaetota bacterium]
MQKKLFTFLIVSLVLFAGYSKTLTIYTYDSLGWIEQEVIPAFEKKHNCTIKLVKFESTGKIMARVILEKRRPKADLIIGLNRSMLQKAKEEQVIIPYKPKTSDNITKQSFIIDQQYYATPYDYGALAIIYDPELVNNLPVSFNELADSQYKIIIQDPRTSSTGTDFFLWTIGVFGDNWKDFWKRLKDNILTITPGWSESFAKFETGEAEMMVSYCTDGAYSHHYYGGSKYMAYIPEEGGFYQLEGAAIVKKTKNKKLAQTFIDFILEKDFQKHIPLNQWMFPVIDIELPPVFEHAVIPEKTVDIDDQKIVEYMEQWLKEWEEIMY